MPLVQDFMFGDNILPEKRLEQHRASLSGVRHTFEVDPAKPRAGEAVRLHVTTAGPIPFDQVQIRYTLDGSLPAPGACRVLDLMLEHTSWDQVDWQYVNHWQGSLPGQPDDTLVRYHAAARVTGTGDWIFADTQADEQAQATDFAVWVSDIPTPAWAGQAVIYHVFVDRFYPGASRDWNRQAGLDEFFGGTLRGVEQKLGYIQDLGYNTLWLSPFFASPTHHGYDATDMYRVEPRLGSNEDLSRLIAALHRRGMRIILDFVANHWSNQHPTMLAAQRDRSSQFYNWYHWLEWPDRYEGFFGVKEMPKLNLTLGSPARRYLLDCARHWLEQGFDGYRLDYAYGPPLDFWVDFRRVCKQTRPDCWLFGEVIHSAPAQKRFSGAFDGQIDFLLAEALRQTFGYGHWKLDQFEAYLAAHEAFFEGVFDRLTILDNHDMNRFLFLAGDDPQKLMLGALALYTLAGSPINYYGTEAGVTQERPTHVDGRGFFEEARQPMLWDRAQNHTLVEYFHKLVSLRRANPWLKGGTHKTVHLDAQGGTMAFLRAEEGKRLLVVLNTSRDERKLSLPALGKPDWQDLLSGLPVRNGDETVQVNLPPQTGIVLG